MATARPTGNLVDVIARHSRDIRRLRAKLAASNVDATYVNVSGDTMSGDLTFSQDNLQVVFEGLVGPFGLEVAPSSVLESALYYRTAVNTWSFEDAVGNKIAAFNADTLTTTLNGVLDLNSNTLTDVADPTSDIHVGDRGYNDARYVKETGDTMTGLLTIEASGQAIRLDGLVGGDPYIGFWESGVRQGYLQKSSNGNFIWNNEAVGGDMRIVFDGVMRISPGGIYFENDLDTGIEHDGTNTIGVYAGGTRRILIAPTNFSAGNVASETTGSAANVHIDATSGQMFRSTSALKYKSDVEDAPELADIELRPTKHWRLDDEAWRYGLVADELVAQEKMLGVYGEQGEVESYDDRAIIAILAAKVNRLEEQLLATI